MLFRGDVGADNWCWFAKELDRVVAAYTPPDLTLLVGERGNA